MDRHDILQKVIYAKLDKNILSRQQMIMQSGPGYSVIGDLFIPSALKCV